MLSIRWAFERYSSHGLRALAITCKSAWNALRTAHSQIEAFTLTLSRQEQQSYNDAPEWRGLHETSPACDVYTLGRMMIAIINGDLGKQLNGHIESFDNDVKYQLDAAVMEFYPQEMVEIAMACTQRVPVLRPKIEELYERVLKQTEKFGKRKELPMRLREHKKGEVILFEADRYLLWT